MLNKCFTKPHISCSCKHAIYFEHCPDSIKHNCEFKYFYNTSVVPSIPEVVSRYFSQHGQQEKYICSEFFNLARPFPIHQYVLVNRSVLCNCEIESK